MFLWFLLRDEERLGGWQSGLTTFDGKRKPSFNAFRRAVASLAAPRLAARWGRATRKALRPRRPSAGARSSRPATPAAHRPHTRLAVEGCTPDDPERHFLGWAGEVDPDELFASGAAWGIRLVRRSL